MLNGTPELQILDSIAFELPEDRMVLEAVMLHGGHTSKWALYDAQKRRGVATGRASFRGVRSVAGCLSRLAERGLIVNDHRDVRNTAVSFHPETGEPTKTESAHLVVIDCDALREEAAKNCKQYSFF